MKYTILLSLLSISIVSAQKEPIILEATTDKNVFLFFPSPIIKALPGNDDFHFAYNQQKAESFGVLKAASNRGESTLHVITEDQSVYSFVVRYNAQAHIFEHFFTGDEKVGSSSPDRIPRPNKDQNASNESTVAKKILDSNYLEGNLGPSPRDMQFCKELVARKDFFKSLFKTNNDVVLKVTDIAYRRDKTFICLSMVNNSTVDYDVNFIQFNKISKKASKRSNYQAIEIPPLIESSFNTFERIASGESQKAVYVFEKLALDSNTLINIELNELRGERNIVLPVTHRHINNPNL